MMLAEEVLFQHADQRADNCSAAVLRHQKAVLLLALGDDLGKRARDLGFVVVQMFEPRQRMHALAAGHEHGHVFELCKSDRHGWVLVGGMGLSKVTGRLSCTEACRR
jgi:hypothetical protein